MEQPPFMSPETLKTVLIVGLFFGLFVVVPIVAILAEHQRKMMRLMRGEKEGPSETAELLAVLNGQAPPRTAEVEALKARVNELEEKLSELQSSLPAPTKRD